MTESNSKKTFGEIIRERRVELGVSRKKLCEYICGDITLLRIENEGNVPSPYIATQLLERLGYPKEVYLDIMYQDDVNVMSLENEIKALNVRFEKACNDERPKIREQAVAKHAELERIIAKKGDGNHRAWQTILRSREIVGKEEGPYSFEESLNILIEAITLTIPNFDINRLGDNLYCEVELRIINQIATVYMGADRHEEALKIMKFLYEYVHNEKFKKAFEKNCAIMITYNYAREVGVVGKYYEAIGIAEIGRRMCIDIIPSMYLASLMATEAECLYYIGDSVRSKELFEQAYDMYKIYEDECNRLMIQETARDLLKIELS